MVESVVLWSFLAQIFISWRDATTTHGLTLITTVFEPLMSKKRLLCAGLVSIIFNDFSMMLF